MYENLLALHTVDPSDQEVITVEDVYVASESVGTQSANKQAKRSRVLKKTSIGHYRNKNLLSHCKKIAGTLVLCNLTISNKIAFVCKLSLL